VKLSLLVSFFLLGVFRVFAGDIKGHIFDKYSNEQLVGVSIWLDPGKKATASALDGSFVMKDVAPGQYHLSLSYIGYITLDTLLSIGTENIQLNFYLNQSSANLATVTISGKANGESELYAKKREQTLDNISNIVSANAISISPDVTVANVIQRVSGISMQRSSYGEGQYAIIRGMDKKYNTTIINGIKIPSPDNKDRFIPLDMFPSELLERMEVLKSLTPSMEGDATGGTVNLVMKNAPDKFRLQANVGAGFSQLFLDRNFLAYNTSQINAKSPAEIKGPNVFATVADFPYQNLTTRPIASPINNNFSLTVGNRFFNKRLGVVFSGSNQSAYKGSNSTVFVQTGTVAPSASISAPLNQTFSDTEVRQYSSKIDRLGVMSKLDFRINANNSISLFATYLQLNEHRVRATTDSLLGGYSIHNYVGAFAVSHKTQVRSDLQSIYNITLQGQNRLALPLTLDWSLVASQAEKRLPDIALFNYAHGINPNVSAGTATAGPDNVQEQTREWQHNTDKDLAAYLNLRYLLPRIGGRVPILGAGMLKRHKERNNYDNKYTLSPITDPGSNDAPYTSIAAAKFIFIPANGALGNAAGNPGIYSFKEDITSGYGQIKYRLTQRLDMIGGLRVENTQQSYNSSLPVSVAGKYGSFGFTDFLPSIQLKDSLSRNGALRFSYFKSLYRPAYADLIPFYDRSTNESYAVVGNPYLKHTVVHNLDLRYEIFGQGLDQLMVGAFFKTLKNPIEYVLKQSGFAAELNLTPANLGTATNFGLEAVYRKYFGNFGVAFNYTYTHSQIRSEKAIYYLNETGAAINATVIQKRPLQGQSAHIGNISLLYKDSRRNIEAQLALVYTGTRINTLSLYNNLDNWEKATAILDFSIQKQLGKRFTIYGKANNLLNTPYKLIIKQHNYSYAGNFRLPFQESPNYVNVQLDRFYASYTVGLRFNIK
jgi:TonB-dependent receptor